MKKVDVLDVMAELCSAMPLPKSVIDAMVTAQKEIAHLRWQCDALQTRGTELALDNQSRRRDQLIKEELHRHIEVLNERLVLAERVALKLHDEDELTEDECYVVEAIGGLDYQRRHDHDKYRCTHCKRLWYGTWDGSTPTGACTYDGSTTFEYIGDRCKEPSCTRKALCHRKPCGCTWDHIRNDWAKCSEHAPPKGPPIIGGRPLIGGR